LQENDNNWNVTERLKIYVAFINWMGPSYSTDLVVKMFFFSL
jgi:hypothetical protein